MNDLRFRVSTGEHAGFAVVTLSDLRAETQAQLVPSFGFPCIAFRVTLDAGVWNVVSEPPDVESFKTRVGRYGVPIMYPWPNRIREGRFTFDGVEYQVPLAPRGPHASHGVTRERAWTVDAADADLDAAFCRASVETGAEPDDVWPFRSRLTVEYRLSGTTLGLSAEAVNLGDVPMPMGFGIHPWFDVPFGSGSTRGQMEVRVPAESFWELDETRCTTGAVCQVSDGFDACVWAPIADRLIDDVYTGLTLEDGWFTAEICDTEIGRIVAVRSNSAFREHVLFAPHHADVICLEPCTCTTDAFNLSARGLDTGMVVLGPGERWRGAMEIVAQP